MQQIADWLQKLDLGEYAERGSALNLNRLGERQIAALIDSVTAISLCRRALGGHNGASDGIPLFVEEMTKAVLEAESEGDTRKAAAAVPSPALAVPASLHASLMARLDRLGPLKEVAQIGSAIGREFSYALLVAVVRKPEAELQSALDQLIAAGLVFQQGIPPHANYLFKHALVQDAASGTLLREPRRALHARIAEAIESRFPEIAESNQNSSPVISPRPASSRKRLLCGAKPVNGRLNAQRWSKQQRSLRTRWIKSPRCPGRPR